MRRRRKGECEEPHRLIGGRIPSSSWQQLMRWYSKRLGNRRSNSKTAGKDEQRNIVRFPNIYIPNHEQSTLKLRLMSPPVNQSYGKYSLP